MKKLTLIFTSILILLGSCEKGPVNGFDPNMARMRHNTYVTNEIKSGSSQMPEIIVSKNGVAQTQLTGKVFCQQVAYDLIAGQTIPAGSISVSNDDVNLYITYKSEFGWKIKEIHLYAGTSAGLPVNLHNVPVPGQFPIKETFDPTVEMVTYEIPIDALEDCFIIAAHAVVVRDGQEETAWGKGDLSFENELGISRWGWLINYCPERCEGKELVVALKSYVVNPDLVAQGNNEPVFWVVSNGIGTSDNCLGIGFNKFQTDDTEKHVYNLIKWGNPDDVKGTLSLWVSSEEGIQFINVEVKLTDVNLAFSISHLYVGTEEGLENYYYKYKGKDCFMFYNWFFQNSSISATHNFKIKLTDINEK